MTSTTQKDSSPSPLVRTCFTDPNVERCKRTNIWMSFLHALITGTLAIYSLWIYSPDIHNDYIGHITWLTYLIGCFSFGYFCYDSMDIISNRRGADMWQMVLHHVIVLFTFGPNIVRLKNVGYQTLTLLAEFNSIFLHIRRLFELYNISPHNQIVRLNMYINQITFIICRFGMLACISLGVYHDGERIGVYYYKYIAYICLPALWIMNPYLLYRLLCADFSRKTKSK
ncbi:unnamed protein product [Adineta ricciae]|uniref:TLC domain-containing protein n=1 Tax=Adineta ricciae TaxID=249248 RepID=A0A813RQT6_ADIRI|nr:unnamed protein product [Adineta ricciae]